MRRIVLVFVDILIMGFFVRIIVNVVVNFVVMYWDVIVIILKYIVRKFII